MSDPIKQRIGITLSVLLLLSVLLNVYLYNKSLKYKGYETTVSQAFSYFSSGYKLGSIHGSLEQSIAENKLYFGEQGRFSNYYQQQSHHLSNMHNQLTLLYGPLHAYVDTARSAALEPIICLTCSLTSQYFLIT